MNDELERICKDAKTRWTSVGKVDLLAEYSNGIPPIYNVDSALALRVYTVHCSVGVLCGRGKFTLILFTLILKQSFLVGLAN
jgi:hypothetical protein